MSKMVIVGSQKLKGEVIVEGSKNSVLPILAATLLNSGISVIKNCPKLKDVDVTLRILMKLGCKVKVEDSTVIVDSSTVNNTDIPIDLATEMRSSIIFLGPMLSRCKKITISFPGGCEIGPRPIDLHVKALRSMGAKIHDVQGGLISCDAEKLVGTEIHLSYPSVGATENIMLASIFAEGETYIHNAAKEPEIIDLQNYLRAMGAEVTGAGTGVINIKGVDKKLKDVEYTIMPDRIVAGTYMIASAITGGEILLKNVIPEHISSIISILNEAGSDIRIRKNEIKICGPDVNKAVDIVRTLPYPGFPTDMQAPLVSLLSIARGTSIIIETVFENRYKHIDELMRMGANITIEGRVAVIKGIDHLNGATVYARDLRGAAALILAGLAAKGETIVEGLGHLDRGYENMEIKLAKLGALIKRKE